MPKSKSINPDQLRAERAELVGHVAAAKARINDLLLAGKDTAAERDDIAKHSIRMMEIDTLLAAEVERQHGDDIVAIDRETQRIVDDFLAAFDALRAALTPPSETVHA